MLQHICHYYHCSLSVLGLGLGFVRFIARLKRTDSDRGVHTHYSLSELWLRLEV